MARNLVDPVEDTRGTRGDVVLHDLGGVDGAARPTLALLQNSEALNDGLQESLSTCNPKSLLSF